MLNKAASLLTNLQKQVQIAQETDSYDDKQRAEAVDYIEEQMVIVAMAAFAKYDEMLAEAGVKPTIGGK